MNQPYVTILNAHNGNTLKISKPVRFQNIQSFKSHLVQTFSDHILDRPENIFLLTTFGIKFNFQIINELNEIFVFDKRLFNQQNDERLIEEYLNQTDGTFYEQLNPGSVFHIDLLFKDISKNLEIIHKNAVQFVTCARECLIKFASQINVFFKSFNIILQFIANLISASEKTLSDHVDYVRLLNKKSLHGSWESHYNTLRNLPKVQFKTSPQAQIGVAQFLDEAELRRSAFDVSNNLPAMVDTFNDFSTTFNEVNAQKNVLDREVESLRKNSKETFESFEYKKNDLFSKIESMSKESLTSAATRRPENPIVGPRNMEIMSEVETVRNYLKDYAAFKRKISREAVHIFQRVARMQMSVVEMKTKIKGLMDTSRTKGGTNTVSTNTGHTENIITQVREAENMLSLTVDLPLLFGFILIEKRRQFEWNEFFSRGVVSNILEQVTAIIDHEHMFQKLWIKKFGNFVGLINRNKILQAQIPSLDIALTNGWECSKKSAIFSILGDVEVERDDIVKYIENVQNHDFPNSKRFSVILEKNYKDLVISTETLKKITNVISNLSTVTKFEGMELHLKASQARDFNGVEKDPDLNLIRDLRQRIRKLEDLLHQLQYSNLSNWPVTKLAESRHKGNDTSMLLATQMTKSVSDPKKLLNVRSRTVNNSKDYKSKPVDVSTTIDKHLDNIRLRKENSELLSMRTHLQNSNADLQHQVKSLEDALEDERNKISQLKSEHENAFSVAERNHENHVQAQEDIILSQASKIADLETNVAHQQHQLDEYQKEKNLTLLKHKEEKDTYKEEKELILLRHKEEKDLWEQEKDLLKQQILDLKEMNGNKKDESADKEKLSKEISDLTAELNDLKSFKSELISNMQAKETEYGKQLMSLENQIKNLEASLEAEGEDYENLMEITQTKARNFESAMLKTTSMIKRLMIISFQLMVKNYKYVEEFCLILESMGLLLVKELNPESEIMEYTVKRVKGLRSRKAENDDPEASITQLHSQKIRSEAIGQLKHAMGWVEAAELEITKEQRSIDGGEKYGEADECDQQMRNLIAIFDKYFYEDDNHLSSFHQFWNAISFSGKAKTAESSTIDAVDIQEAFFYKAIAKRFNDVEGFAKKLTKEIKSKSFKNSRLIEVSKKQIAVNNFEKGDLALFLPTQIERNSKFRDEIDEIPWTAFNIDAPNYFLESSQKAKLGGDEWFIGKITNIKSREVSEANFENREENPHRLNKGILWYVVQTD